MNHDVTVTFDGKEYTVTRAVADKLTAITGILPTVKAGNGQATLPDTMPKDKGPARNEDNVPLEKGDIVILIGAVKSHYHGEGQETMLSLVRPDKKTEDGEDQYLTDVYAGGVFAKLTDEQCKMLGIELKGE